MILPLFAFSMPGFGELLVVLVIVLLLFGASRIPQVARSLGEAVKEFKKSSRDPGDQGPSSPA